MAVQVWFRKRRREALSLLFFFAMAATGHAQGQPVVCRAGTGNFETTFPTGVSVQVGPVRKEGMARRVCEAALLWNKSKTQVATDDAQADLDAFGIDLGLGAPVALFQAKKADSDCCMTLRIYSLRRPPKLLRTISGGRFFSIADTDLDGRIEIWTTDAAAMIGFEGSNPEQPQPAPTVVLRFERGRLTDVSSEFQGYFDDEIAKARAGLSAEALGEFKDSDGRLPHTAYFSQEDLLRSERLQHTKVIVLQIVWAYLYSGRETKAWETLAELWPASDVERIRAAIVSARARGIRNQVDAVSTRTSAGTQKLPEIFDARTLRTQDPGLRWAGRAPEEKVLGITPPDAIWVGRVVYEGQVPAALADSGILVDLVIDSAGKVRSAASADPAFDTVLKNDTARWKFVPALREGRAIASRVYLIVSPKQ